MYFKIKGYRFASAKIVRPLTILVLADLHGREYPLTGGDLLGVCRDRRPDLILLPGDLVTAREDACFAPAEELLCSLAKLCPVYLSNGNHETKLRMRIDREGWWCLWNDRESILTSKRNAMQVMQFKGGDDKMKMIKKWFCALTAALLMLGTFAAVPAEAASLIRSTQPYYNYLADCDAELFGGFKIQTSYPNSELTRSGGGKEYAIIAQQSGRAINGVANDTTVLYSLYEKNVLSIWKANISTLKKTQVAKITVKAKEAELCAYYNNTVYYRATSQKGAKLLFSYPLSTKVSKKIGSGVYPCAQVSGFLVYTRDKLDGSEGAYLKCYNMKTKKSVSMDNAAESVRRWGKYIYYSRYGENIYKVANMTARVPSLEVIRYDLDTNQKTTLLNIDRHSASVARITGEGVYHRTPDDAYGKYTDFATEDTRDAEPYEISGI